jgi:TonB family protein
MSIHILIAALMAATTGTPAKPIDPGSWVTPSDYPRQSLIDHTKGVVAFRLSVDTTGKPDACGILNSSGSQELDSVTCDLLLARAHFKAATGSDGNPIRSTYSSSVRWLLDDRPDPWESTVASVHDDLDTAGGVSGCRETHALTAGSGGCAIFGQAALFSHVFPQPLTKFRAIEVRFISEASGRPLAEDIIPSGATRVILSRVELKVDAAGGITGCTEEEALKIGNASNHPCASFASSKGHFVPMEGTPSRTMRLIIEAVAERR